MPGSSDKRALVTGSSGFLGRILTGKLEPKYSVDTLDRGGDPQIICDLSTSIPELEKGYDLVVHAAGKAHVVPKTEEEKRAFFEVNVQGTIHLLKALERVEKPVQFVFISTVAVYGLEEGDMIDETTSLQGDTPYAESKIRAELLVEDFCREYGINCLILRLPLVVGPEPKGNLLAMIEAIRKGRFFTIDGGKAARSMVLAEDVADLIANSENTRGIFNLTDGRHPTYRELADALCRAMGKRPVMNLSSKLLQLPAWLGEFLLGNRFPLTPERMHKLTKNLTFDDRKARQELNWQPRQVLEHIDTII